MKITIRIPTETYAYYEIECGSIEEYEKDYPRFTKIMESVRNKIKLERDSEPPFEGKDPWEFQKKIIKENERDNKKTNKN